jgi:hypothetical protein
MSTVDGKKRPAAQESQQKPKKQKQKEQPEPDSDDEEPQEVDCLQVMVTGEDGKQRIEYEVNHGALMGTGRYETFNESRVICFDRDDTILHQRQQWVGGQYG